MDLGSEARKEAHDASRFLGVECVMVVNGESPDPGRVGTCPPFLEWSLVVPCLSQKAAVSGLEMGEEQEHKEEDLCKASGFSRVCLKGRYMPRGRANTYYCRNTSEYCVEGTNVKFDSPAPSGRV